MCYRLPFSNRPVLHFQLDRSKRGIETKSEQFSHSNFNLAYFLQHLN